MADDLVSLTLDLCGKVENKNPRFPKLFYGNYVDRLINLSCDIQENIIMANDYAFGKVRKEFQLKATAKCTVLNHLVRIAWQFGWISNKQRDRWQGLTTAIKYAVIRWIKSDESRG